jgi:hypothetical protein
MTIWACCQQWQLDHREVIEIIVGDTNTSIESAILDLCDTGNQLSIGLKDPEIESAMKIDIGDH